MVSATDKAKRVLVSLLKTLAAAYSVTLKLTRESSDAEVRTAFRKVSRKVHPDQGGSVADQTALNSARDVWETALKEAAGKHGGDHRLDKGLATTTAQQADADGDKAGFRVRALGVLLTYQKFEDIGVWLRFLTFVGELLQKQGVKFWCATLETNADKTYHLHLMLQFYKNTERASKDFAFEGVCPNARPNDLLGEGCFGDGLALALGSFSVCLLFSWGGVGLGRWGQSGHTERGRQQA